MASGSMLRVTQNFSLLNIQTTPWCVSCRNISNKSLLEKLGLPEKPKKPMTPFLAFASSVRDDIKKQNPEAGVTEISRIASKLWKECGSNEKEKYAKKFKVEYEKYKNDLEEYEKSLTVEQKAEIKEALADIKALKEEKLMKLVKQKREKEFNKPKYPTQAFFKFAFSIDKGNDKPHVHVKKMSEKWSKLPDSVKEKYMKEYAEEKDKYMKDLAAWEEKMIKQGNVDIVRSKTLKQKLKV